ncbi:MAG: hypothetical protein WCE90_11095 [Candidatus Zixiibacteriota bacterium]
MRLNDIGYFGKSIRLSLIFLTLPFLFFSISSVRAQTGRICGVIHTRDGEVLEGPIRWDKNEAFWDDILDATKETDRGHQYEGRRERHIEIFGLDIRWDEDRSESRSGSGIQFGYLKSLERRSRNRAILELKNGEKITFYESGTDIGSGIRGILIDDPAQGEVELDWDDLDAVNFEECNSAKIEKAEKRLYGTVETERGDKFKGFVNWDMDELFYSDILDGEEGGHTRKIPFGKIAAIERRSSSSSWVYMRNGDKIKLSGSNDVDSGNRGIVVTDPDFGRVTIPWDDFERLDLLDEADKHLVAYDQFGQIEPLYGVVYDEDGKSYEGNIKWDDDETENWELLNGLYRDLDVDVEFSQIAKIEKVSSRGVEVTLKKGNRFRLTGSNDVNEDNRGIFVTTKGGDEIQLDWRDFDHVVFKEK